MLRLAVPQAGALEIAHEGPEVGAHSALFEPFELEPNRIGLAVFTSEGCGLCRVLAPTVQRFGAHPSVVLRTFDEVEHAAAMASRRRAGQPVRGRARRRRHGAGQGHVQQRRAAGVGAGHGGTATRGYRRVRRARIADAVAGASSRRGFLARVGAAVVGATGVGALVAPGDAEAYHFCGHIYTTDSCPHPTGLPRIDAKGLPIRAKDGRPVDDQGRYIDATGSPVDEDGNVADRRRRHAAAAHEPDAGLRGRRGRLRLHAARRRRLVPLLRRPRAQARGLLRHDAQPDQRRQGAEGLLLPRPQGLLRHVLPDEGPLLRAHRDRSVNRG